MANWNSALAALQLAGRSQVPSHGLGFNTKSAQGIVALGSGAALNDTINFFKLPAGARIIHAQLNSTDIDTNGSPAVTIDVGDATNGAAAIFSASIVGQAGGVDAAPVVSALGLQYAAETMITGKIHAAAGTPAAGTLVLTVLFVVDALAS